MSAHQAEFPIVTMARVLGVSKAGYYAWLRRPPSARAVADRVLMKRIRTIHVTSHETYGVPRVHAELRAGGQKHGRKRIARLMRAAGIVGVSRRRARVVTTQRDKDARPGRSRLFGLGTEPALGRRHHVHPDCGRLSLLGRGAGCVQPPDCRAGRWQTICGRNWCWTRSEWRLGSGSRRT